MVLWAKVLGWTSDKVFGLSRYQMPILKQVIGATQTFTLADFNLLSIYGGGFAGLKIWESEFISWMRLQYPISGTGAAKLSNGISFDGALTYLSPSASKKSYWGLTWGGQYHSLNYNIQSENNTNRTFSIFISKMDFIYGYSF